LRKDNENEAKNVPRRKDFDYQIVRLATDAAGRKSVKKFDGQALCG
jgi:hypothetical protein